VAAKEFDAPMAGGGGSYAPTQIGTVNAPPNRITLHLGVIDQPYQSYQQPEKVPMAKKGKANRPVKPKSEPDTKTTGEVAEILEEKYGILDTFAFARLPDIAKALEDSIAGELETLLMGGSPSGDPFKGAESAITTMMKKFISTQEIEHMGIEGVPTQAAKDGVNHRLKHPYAKANPRRPSFMDTTLYWNSLRAWFK
jgi:hypothetical protein